MEKAPSSMSLEKMATVPEEAPGKQTKFEGDGKKMVQQVSVGSAKAATNQAIKAKGRNMSITNPASKIPAIKATSKVLSLKGKTANQTCPPSQNSRPTTPSSDSKRNSLTKSPPAIMPRSPTPVSKSRMSLMSKKDDFEKKSFNSASKTSLATNTANEKAQSHRPPNAVTSKINGNRGGSNQTRASISMAGNQKTNLRKTTSTAGDQNSPQALEKKLTDLQSEFLTKIQADPDKSFEYRFVSVVHQNGECKLLIKDKEKGLPELPSNSVNDFKAKILKYMNESFAQLLGNSMENENSNSQEKIRQLQDSNTKALFDYIDDLCKSYKEKPLPDSEVEYLKQELEECKATLAAAETKSLELSKKHDEDLVALKNQFNSKIAEIAQRESAMRELENRLQNSENQRAFLKSQLQSLDVEKQEEINTLKESLRKNQESTNAMQKNFMLLQQQLINEINENQNKTVTLKAMGEELQKLQLMVEQQNISENSEEIQKLRDTIKCLEEDKSSLEEHKRNLKEELNSSKEMLIRYQETQEEIKSLREQLKVKDEMLDKSKLENAKDNQMELAKLRQSETEKCREIQKLKMELSKAQYNITKLEEQIQRDQQLLDIRSDLINSLQTNETSQRIQLEEFMAQMGEKNSTINQLTNDLRVKTEEFQNLYTNINDKQVELSNQEHMIKLLEESNERCQLLRVQQEEKIGRLEEDIAHLKQTIAMHVNSHTKLNCDPPLSENYENYSENFHHYTSQRKRKRRIAINVRKYET
ncbi:centromere-associated protein E isoform X1 [Musca domestica]|uniref:Centromere-associated protein E isoform X1 n=1 Tax=Musca domestica TaxID=7370 RepID=A0A9J7I0R9_MUSDO|nr:centromere-associated protein E isoform X1 [Musca domestica]